MSMSGNSPEVIRQRFLKQETHFKQMGSLNLFFGVMIGLGGCAALFAPPKAGETPNSLIGLLLFVLSVAYIVLGRMLQKLDPRVRVPMTLLAIVELFELTLGTVKGIYFLYLFHSQAGKYIFSQEYKQVMAATPHIKYKTSKGLLIVLGVLLLFLVVIGIIASLSK